MEGKTSIVIVGAIKNSVQFYFEENMTDFVVVTQKFW